MADYCGAIGISLSQQGGRDDDVSPNTNTNTNTDTDVAVSSDYMLSGNPSSSTAGCAIRGGKGSSKSPSPSGEITIYRKPRGRPQGSKNKPKPPVIITKDSDAAMKSVLLEISPGSDVVESIIHYARRRHVGISVFSASGTVSNVTLRHPGGSPGPMMSLLHGPFSILSLSGSFVEKSFPSAADSSEAACSEVVVGCYNSFGICLTVGQGQVFGGIVGGKVVAESSVMVVATTFVNPMVQRLPLPSYNLEEACGGPVSGGRGGEYEAEETKPCIESRNIYGGGGGGVASPAASSCQRMTSPEQVMPWGPPSSSPNY